MVAKIRTDSVEGTRRVAAAIEPHLRAGDLLILSGDLGGGKTAFVQGLAAAMGVHEPVTSPTFVLEQSYQGRRLRLHHIDVYRLDRLEEAIDLGIPELLRDDAVTAVEWGERILSEVPADYLMIRFDLADADDARLLEIEPVGPSWQERAAAVEAAVRAC